MRTTPIDTGAVLEPKVWVNAGRAGQEHPRPAVDDDYGRVDFDDADYTAVAGLRVVPADGREELAGRDIAPDEVMLDFSANATTFIVANGRQVAVVYEDGTVLHIVKPRDGVTHA